MLDLYQRRTGFLAIVLCMLLSLSCAEDVVLPGEETGEWVSVPAVRESIGSNFELRAEGIDEELYIGGSSGGYVDGTGLVLFTDDAGITWDLRGKGLNPGNEIVDFVILADGTVFAGMRDGGVFRSMDRGMTWIQVNNHLTDLYIISLVTIPDGRLLVSTEEGLFFSSDRGDSWAPCLSDSIFPGGMYLESDNDRGVVYATHYNSRVFYSDDNCSTWQAMPEPGVYYISDLRIDAGGSLYLFKDSVLLKYLPEEEEWMDITPGSDDQDHIYMVDFMIDPEGDLYVVSWDQRVLWSGDGGSSWQEKRWGISALFVRRIFSHKDCLFVAGPGYSSSLFRSIDEGDTWQCAGLSDSYIQDLLVDSSGGMMARTKFCLYEKGLANNLWTIFFAPEEGCWQNIFPNSVTTALCPDGDILFSMCGLVRVSGEGGPDHKIFGEDTLVISIAVDPAGMIFLATEMGVMRSLDNGGSWETVLPEQTEVLELEANIDSTVYLATANGLVISKDYGSTWETRLDSRIITAINSDPDGSIYAGVAGGIMFSPDRGKNWEMIDFEGYNEIPRTLEISSRGRVVALTNHRRLYLIEDGGVDIRVIFSELPPGIGMLVGEDGYIYYFERQIFRFSVPVDML